MGSGIGQGVTRLGVYSKHKVFVDKETKVMQGAGVLNVEHHESSSAYQPEHHQTYSNANTAE